MANDDEEEKKRIEKSNLIAKRNCLNNMKEAVERLWASLYDQKNVLGQVNYVLLDSQHILDVDCNYSIDKIMTYGMKDDIYTLNYTISDSIEKINDEKASLSGKNDSYRTTIQNYASKIDTIMAGCGDQIDSINNAINTINSAINRL